MATKSELMNAGHDEIYKLLEKHGIKAPRCGAGCGMGWIPLIDTLIQELIAAGWDKDCAQIKEKFGGLRFYIGAGSDEIHDIISKYEKLSYKTCEACGNPGKSTSSGWIKTLCEEHAKEK